MPAYKADLIYELKLMEADLGYSIELYFEPTFEEKITHLWDDLSKAAIPSIFQTIGSRPHLSLAVMNECNESQLSILIRDFCNSISPFSIEFPAIGLIPGKLQTVFLAPVENHQLYDAHKTLFLLLQDSGNSMLDRYKPSKWLPHCSISKELSATEALNTIEICQHSKIFGKTKVVELGFIKFRPRRLIQSYSFNKRNE